MRKILTIATATLLLAAAAPAIATPDKPLNAAVTTSDTVCSVGRVNGEHANSSDCQVHVVEKLNKDGSLAFFRYQDKGTLLPGMTPPETAEQGSVYGYILFDVNGTLTKYDCTGTEFVEPSGQYSSNLTCKS